MSNNKETLNTYIKMLKKLKKFSKRNETNDYFNTEEYKKALQNKEKIEAECNDLMSLSRRIK